MQYLIFRTCPVAPAFECLGLCIFHVFHVIDVPLSLEKGVASLSNIEIINTRKNESSHSTTFVSYVPD